ncbi:MAG: hypothetical protein QXI49_06140 [Candidatus Methanomethylicaceae archaeon]
MSITIIFDYESFVYLEYCRGCEYYSKIHGEIIEELSEEYKTENVVKGLGLYEINF